jgi:hypothetical protein
VGRHRGHGGSVHLQQCQRLVALLTDTQLILPLILSVSDLDQTAIWARRFRSVITRAGNVVFLLIGATCSSPLEAPGPVASIRVSPSSSVLHARGNTIQLLAELRDASGRILPKGVSWETSNALAAVVDSNGLVTAVGDGTAEIVARHRDLEASGSIEVARRAAELVKLNDDQVGRVDAMLARSIRIIVRDSGGYAMAGSVVHFSVSAGAGILDDTVVNTDSTGTASVRWRLGSIRGSDHRVMAKVDDLIVEFQATAKDVEVFGFSTASLVMGEIALIRGQDLVSASGNHRVLMDGVSAAIVSARGDSVLFRVPNDCRATRQMQVRVISDGLSSASVGVDVVPKSFLELSVGAESVFNPDSVLCLQFRPETENSQFIIGVQDVGDARAELTNLRLRSDVWPFVPSLQYPDAKQEPARGRALNDLRLQRHWVAEQRLRSSRQRNHGSYSKRYPPQSSLRASVETRAEPGDVVGDLRVWDLSPACQGFESVGAEVRTSIDGLLVLEDTSDIGEGLTPDDYAVLASLFEAHIQALMATWIGSVSDIDGNDQVVVLVTSRVANVDPDLLGFVTDCDFLDRSNAPSSNQGEIIFIRAPSENLSADELLRLLPPLLAHEMSHVVQIGTRLGRGHEFLSDWEAEGQAVLMEELLGHSVSGRESRQNYGRVIASSSNGTEVADWYSTAFDGLAAFFGAPVVYGERLLAAPGECSWLALGVGSNCDARAAIYGASWSFHRWLLDHHGLTFDGGASALLKALVAGDATGLANVERVTGHSRDSLLTRWSASLAVDGMFDETINSLAFSSWDLNDVFDGDGLKPRVRPFGPYSDAFKLGPGGVAYWNVLGVARPNVALRISSSDGAPLPSTVRVWIVRVH